MTEATATLREGQERTDRALYNRIALRVVPILFIVQLLGMIDRFNVGFAKIEMSASIGLSEAAYGLGAGLFFLGYFVFEIPSNLILARVGAKVWFTRILVTWGFATVAMAFVPNATWFYILRFLVGAAEAGFAPGVQLYFSRWFPNFYRGRVNALFLMSIPFAGMISGPISGYVLAQFTGVSGMANWQWLFVVEGAITICFAPILFAFLSDNPRRARWLTPEEQAQVEFSVATSGAAGSTHSIGEMFRSRRTLLLAAVYFLLLLGNYGISFWMPQIIRDSGIASTVTIGWLSSIPSLVTIATMPVVSRLSDRGGRKWFIAGGCLISATGLLLTSTHSDDTVIAMIGMTMTAAGVLGVVPVFWAYLARCYTGAAAVVGFAAVNSIGNLAGFVAPYQIGLAADATGSPVIGIYAIAAGGVLAALLVAVFFSDDRGAQNSGKRATP